MKRFLWLLLPCGLIAAGIGAAMVDIEMEPKPEIRVVQILSRGVERTYLMEMVNPGSQDLEYWGYGAEGPMYQMQNFDSGEWKDAMLGWCGMGAAPQRLRAHGSQRFEIMVRDTPSRVGLLLLPPAYQRAHVYQLEWLPFSLRAGLVQWQNERLDERAKKRVVWSERLEPLPPITVLTTQVTQRPNKGGLP